MSVLVAVLRNDLRVLDHPIFHAAHFQDSVSSKVKYVLPVYCFDERQIELSGIEGYTKVDASRQAKTRVGQFWKCGIHRTKFLHESLTDLQSTLQKLGNDLHIYFGQPEEVVPAIVKALSSAGHSVEAVYLSAENTSEEIQIQERLESALKESQTRFVLSENQRTLIHRDDLPFDPAGKQMPDVYTDFRKRVEGLGDQMVRPQLRSPTKSGEFKPCPPAVQVEGGKGIMQLHGSLQDILQPLLKPLLESDEVKLSQSTSPHPKSKPEDGLASERGGLTAAQARLDRYININSKDCPVATYKETRNGLLGEDFSTKFSKWLANGSMSPKVAYAQVEAWEDRWGANKSSYWVKFELLWRDFFSFLIEKHGNKFFYLSGLNLPAQEAPVSELNTSNRYDSVVASKKGSAHPSGKKDTIDGYWLRSDWEKGPEQSDVMKFCIGRTGVPFIDANMIELNSTGFMSNRGRQNVASHFTKDMGRQDWRIGAEWFESYLDDYDVTSNWGNWQYQAGVGVDPRSSRQFNIIKQGKDYDAHGAYVAHWLPALAEVYKKHNVDLGWIHHPWTISAIKGDLLQDDNLKVYANPPKYEQRSWKGHYNRNTNNEENKAGRSGQNGRGGRGRGRGRGNGKPRGLGPRGGQQKEAQMKAHAEHASG